MLKTKELQTAAALAAVMLLIYFLADFRILGMFAVFFLVMVALDLAPAMWFIKGWEKFSHFVGLGITKILLAIIFYAVITPLSWLFRLFNRRWVETFFGRQSESHYIGFSDKIDPAFFERMW